jgi:hypothetical protein
MRMAEKLAKVKIRMLKGNYASEWQEANRNLLPQVQRGQVASPLF